MIQYSIISYYIILLLLPALSVAGNLSPVLGSIRPNSITIIGETHQHPESIQLFHSLIKSYLKKDTCLTVALEIHADQQYIFDNIMQGRAVASDLEISSIIDQPALRNLIDNLAQQKMNGACLEILALDNANGSRDSFMASRFKQKISTTPIIALLGNLHSLKAIKWDLSMTKGKLFVAEILNKQGISVSSYPQVWQENSCSDKQSLQFRLVPNNSNESLSLLNSHFINNLNAHEFKSSEGVVDGLIVWSCKP